VSVGVANAKINLALVVGPRGAAGKHAIATLYQRLDLADEVEVEPSDTLRVEGFGEDTLIRGALDQLAEAVGVEPRWSARVTKRIPVAAGLGGGSSDAAAALRLAAAQLANPPTEESLHRLAARLGADVPFFLRPGPQLGQADGTELTAVDLPQGYWVTLVLPADAAKESTATVYRCFDERDGARGFEGRRAMLLEALGRIEKADDLALLPANDLATSPLTERLRDLGAFRADVTGAGPAVYGLFSERAAADRAAEVLRTLGRTLVARPAW
jgi:4-diphosphocytidyl-2-C-methyl-D-erythritol kinase